MNYENTQRPVSVGDLASFDRGSQRGIIKSIDIYTGQVRIELIYIGKGVTTEVDGYSLTYCNEQY